MEKDYKKTGWVNGSEPDMDAEHMNNIEDGIDGLYHPEFDDSGTVEGITSFPAFLSTVINKMNPIAFYKNFKAGMKYVLHTGSLINNGLCTETGKYAADATQLNPNIENTLAWKVAKANSDLASVQADVVSGLFYSNNTIVFVPLRNANLYSTITLEKIVPRGGAEISLNLCELTNVNQLGFSVKISNDISLKTVFVTFSARK